MGKMQCLKELVIFRKQLFAVTRMQGNWQWEDWRERENKVDWGPIVTRFETSYSRQWDASKFFSFLNNYFLAALGLRCCVQASHCCGFSCRGAGALGVVASVVAARGLSSCGSWALERRLSSCGARA